MQKLATIEKITNITPIKDADRIVLATVKGWNVIVKKDEYKVGDLCVYIQIDTIMPEKPEYEFLSKNNYRIKTLKLKGVLSQGLIVPVPSGIKAVENTDLTEIIGVKKYQKDTVKEKSFKMRKKGFYKYVDIFKYNYLYKWFPVLVKKSRLDFPTHLVSKTDETRIQNIPEILSQHKGKLFFGTAKLDGSSITIIHEKGFFNKSKFRICSRNFELVSKDNDWYSVFKTTNFKNEILKLVKHFKTNDIIVQGEAIGKFNGNHHNLTNNEIRLFNIFVNGVQLTPMSFHETVSHLDIPHCPLVYLWELNETLDSILKLSEIKDVLNPNVQAEGIVWRSENGDVSFKVINNNYLLTEK